MKYFFSSRRRRLIKVNLLLLFIFSFVFFSYSQEKPIAKPKSILFINKYSFDNKETGIPKLVRAYDQMEMLDCSPAPCSKEVREKQSKIIVEPVLNEISDSIKKLENRYNLIIFDGVELEAKGQLLYVSESLDITKRFIEHFNNSKIPDESIKFPLSQNKILTINTNKFSDSVNGLKGFSNLDDCLKTNLCPKIGDAIIAFAKRNDYSFIFDSGKELPKEINKEQTTDVTKQFISEYNKNN